MTDCACADSPQPSTTHLPTAACCTQKSPGPNALLLQPRIAQRRPPPWLRQCGVLPEADLAQPSFWQRRPPPCVLHSDANSVATAVQPAQLHVATMPRAVGKCGTPSISCGAHRLTLLAAERSHSGNAHRLPPPCDLHFGVGHCANLKHPSMAHGLRDRCRWQYALSDRAGSSQLPTAQDAIAVPCWGGVRDACARARSLADRPRRVAVGGGVRAAPPRRRAAAPPRHSAPQRAPPCPSCGDSGTPSSLPVRILTTPSVAAAAVGPAIASRGSRRARAPAAPSTRSRSTPCSAAPSSLT